MLNANTTAVGYWNDAVSLAKAGQYEQAAAMHQEALESKIAAFGEESIQAAIFFNGPGENLLRAGKLDEAEFALRKALKVRDSKENGGLGLGPASESAVTRDNMGELFEAQGMFDEARTVRLSGAVKDQTACSNSEVSRATLKVHMSNETAQADASSIVPRDQTLARSQMNDLFRTSFGFLR